ncbi:hypothetical protein [Streptomyces sp. NBC_00094]|uniref:hypothetical protein n=1 Tax=Streptomyces sp. NBC_00094 TaxID=2903620 RepID=UPI00224F05CA|nr:hypothetical protein [Streptomyces sp. NBC_00094]MCX5391160.1 hypothetical protein [Streptomyces sp. NBC_00094]
MHASPLRPLAATLLCAAVALSAVACGPSADGPASAKPDATRTATPTGPFGGATGSQILDQAIGATKAAKSLTLSVDVTSDGEPLKAYLSVDTREKCAGTLTIGTTGTAELIKVDAKTAYLRFDESLLRAQGEGESPEVQEAILQQLRGRWTKTSPTDPDTGDMLALCDLKGLLAEFEQGGSGITKGGETTVGGQKALKLTEAGDVDGETTTVYVATEGKPHLLKIVTTGGDEPGTIAFSRYDRPVEAKAPPAKSIFVTE